MIAGNHDNQALLDAVYRPVLGELGLHVLGTPKRPQSGGMLALRTRDGEPVNVAALPFLSHRYAVRAAEVLLHEFAEHALDYAQRVSEIVQLLTEGFTSEAVNLVMAHATLLGGRRGGGEREVQTSLDYELPASMFPVTAHYVALGHLHRWQEIPGPCPIFYSGSPLAIDFGEEANDPVALIVTAEPGIRADAQAGADHRRPPAADAARDAGPGDFRRRAGGRRLPAGCARGARPCRSGGSGQGKAP